MANKKIPVFHGTEERQPETPLEQADVLLSQIRALEAEAADLDARRAAELEALDRKYARIGETKAEKDAVERDLKALLRKRRNEIFGAGDLVFTDNGKLIWSQGEVLHLPSGALDAIKREGWIEAIRITEKVDKTVVETWPDERLAAIGASRGVRNEFKWEPKK